MESPRQKIHAAHNWLCYYGSDRSALALRGYRLFILNADAFGALNAKERAGRIFLAYLSIGEINRNSRLWQIAEERPWLASVNPHWPEATRVDARHPAWQRLVNREAQRLLAAGYDGLFLDTVDAGQALLAEDPERYQGVRAATASIIRSLRRAFPRAVIIMNGGFDILADVAGDIDGVMYEGVRHTYDFARRAYRRREPEEIEWLDKMASLVKSYGLPFFGLEYLESGIADRALREEMRKIDCRPFAATIELDRLPGDAP